MQSEILKTLKKLVEGTFAAGNIKTMEDAAILIRLYNEVEYLVQTSDEMKKELKVLQSKLPINEEP